MNKPKEYKIIIPYSESANPGKKFKIEYQVKALTRQAALEEAEKEFNSYTENNSASWVRFIERESIRIWKILPDLPQTPGLIDELSQKLHSDDEDVLYNSLKILGELEDSAPSSDIIRLFKHKNIELAALAVETIGKIGDPSNLTPVTQFYSKDLDPKIQATIFSAASKLALPGDNIYKFLKKGLKNKDSRVIANAIEAFLYSNCEEKSEMIAPFLDHPDNRIKANAIRVLWGIHPSEPLLETLKGMTSSEDILMITSAIFVLEKVEIPGREDLLFSLTKNEHPKIKENAKNALLGLDNLSCIPFWIELIEDEKDFSKVTAKILTYGQKATSMLLSFSGTSSESRKNVARIIKILEQKVLRTDGWVSWIKTKQRSIRRTSIAPKQDE
jgi:HEAT repeat protein